MNQSKPFSAKVWRFLLYIACASLTIALMNVGAKLSDKDVAPPQLPNNPAAVQATLGANPDLRSVAEEWFTIDYVFIAVYVMTAFLIAFSISTDRLSVVFRYLKYLAPLIVLGGAVFDVREDLAEQAAYQSHALSDHIQTFTAFKFGLFFTGYGLLVFLAAVRDGHIGQSLARWTRALYFLRIPIVVISLLALLPFMDASSSSVAEMSRGIFAVEGGTELFFAGLAAFSLCWSAMIVSRVILAYSSERFSLTPPAAGQAISLLVPPDEIKIDTNIEWTTIALWSIPGWFFVSRVVAVADYCTPSWEKWIIAAISAFAAFAILALADLVRLHEKDRQQKTDHAFVLPTDSWLATKAADSTPLIGNEALLWRLLNHLGPGYTDPTPGLKRVHSGHVIAIGLVAILGAVYISLGWASKPGGNSLPVAVAAYVAILLELILWLGASLSFFLDRYRVTVLLAFVAVISLWGRILDTDHYYTMPRTGATAAPGLTPKQMLNKWAERHASDHSPLVIVTAAGGGIQAAAWTTIVLKQLEDAVPQFRESIVLISSVSGGSVGTMYFAGTYVDGCKTADIENLAASSSLRQVAWGFAYPDALRIFFGGLAGEEDRATAMEKAWQQYRPSGSAENTKWCGADHKLSEWRKAAADGKQPAVIFNATITETGQRFLITNFKAEDYSSTGRTLAQIHVLSQQAAVAFDRNYPENDLDITTAARLSATFPVVTPVARPRKEDTDTGVVHAGDGGYFDNYGVASAIEWLHEAEFGEEEKTMKLLGNHQLLWIVIRATPEHNDDTRSTESLAKTKRWGTVDQALAPLTTLVNVRSASQWERDLAELEQVYERLNSRSATSDSDRSHPLPAPSKQKMQIVSFEYRDDHPPLSWHLTSVQRRQLKCNWAGNQNDTTCTSQGWQEGSLKKVQAAFGPVH
jgi:hypothetical protein